ncbi:hypothetical protein JXC34_01785 [Candidatus Woesearchaeota archaeon]|nr:hypothetical protein [Candidatus Woesearchaeota archaeon]
MTLAKLINDLKDAVKKGGMDIRTAYNFADGRVIPPEDIEDFKVKVDVEYSRKDKASPPYFMNISGNFGRSLHDVQPVLDDFLAESKSFSVGRKVAEVKFGVFWTPDAFLNETKLTGLDEVEIASIAYTCDQTKTRIGIPGQSHEIETTTKGTRMSIKASGNYRRQLGEIIDKYNPQYAKITLSQEDAERLLRNLRNNFEGKVNIGLLEEALQPEERQVMSFSISGGIGSYTQEVIEFIIPTKHLNSFEMTLGLPLLHAPSEQESQVAELIKIYGIGGLLRKERLSDLQALARDIRQMDLGILYGHPVLPMSSAKELLESEIDIISKGYDNLIYLGLNSRLFRGGIVKRLAREHFGDEIVDGFDELTVYQYVTKLKTYGYKPEYGFEREPAYVAKERHLLECFRQSYFINPKESVQRFRDWYQNTEPELSVYAKADSIDASYLRKLKIPSQSNLFSFSISNKWNSQYRNSIAVTRILPSSDEVFLWSRTSIDSPILLPLQEQVIRELGIQVI